MSTASKIIFGDGLVVTDEGGGTIRVEGCGGGGGLQFNSGTYGPDNVGDWLMVETDDVTNIPFSLPSNVTPDNASGGGEAHNNKYGALFTKPQDAPFYVWALNIFDDARSPASGFANGLEIVVGTDGPSAKGIDMVVESEDGTGSGVGIGMTVSSDSGSSTGIQLIAAPGDTGSSLGIDAVYGNGHHADSAHLQTGISSAGNSQTTAGHDTIAFAGLDENNGAGDSYAARLESSAEDGNSYGAWLSAASTSGLALAIKVAAGLCDLGLPTSPGPTGTLYSNLGIVTVSP